MLGAIFGDIVGSICERHNVKRTDFQLLTRYSHPTDDSIMTLAVAQALMETWDIWSDTSVLSSDRDLAVLKALTANMQSMGRMYPDAGYGGAFRKWIRLDDPQPYGSWGNGSAMRVSPVGWLCNTLDDVLCCNTCQLHLCHNIVTDVMIKLTLNLTQLTFALLWERVLQVSTHHLFPITHYISKQHVQTV